MNYLKISSITYALFITLAFIYGQLREDHSGYLQLFIVMTLGYIAILQHIILKKLDT